MSYSTGEIAELCGVTVRTVQYYDREGLLKQIFLSVIVTDIFNYFAENGKLGRGILSAFN